jgi:signal transduction histidine kinase
VAVEAADLGTWRWDVERGEVVGSERCRALLDLPSSPGDDGGMVWRSREFLDGVHPDDGEALIETARRCLREHGTPMDVEFRAVRRDGTTRWLRATGRGQRPGPDQPESIYGVLSDVEPRKRAEAERRDLLRRLEQAHEDEQRRIARELHDQVGQTVTGLSLGLKGLERMVERERAGRGVRDQVRWLQALTKEIGRDIHRAASDLRPTALDDLGLHRALLAYASSWSQRCSVTIDVQTVGSDARLPAEVETAAYRAVQEALTNVLKHAAARNVSVVLERKADQLRVIVEDDGRGFDPEAAPAAEWVDEDGRVRHRIGLSGIRERLGLVGGTMALESAPGAGTALFVRIPIPPSEPRARGA